MYTHLIPSVILVWVECVSLRSYSMEGEREGGKERVELYNDQMLSLGL